MGSTMTFLKHIPTELLVEYIIPCLQLVEVKEFMQTCVLYYKIGKSQMYKQFIYRLNRRLYELHPALLLQQFDSFNADWYPQIHNRIVYGDLLQEVYSGFKPNPSIQSYNYTVGFWIHHGEESQLGIPRSVIFGQDNIPESQGTICFQLTSASLGTRTRDGSTEIYRLRRRIWDASGGISINSSGLQVHKKIRIVTESVVADDPIPLYDYLGLQIPGLGLFKTPYLSGSTLVVPPGVIQ